MLAVIFEVVPVPGRKREYLDIAAELGSEPEKIEGFVSVERFQSLTNEGKILTAARCTNQIPTPDFSVSRFKSVTGR